MPHELPGPETKEDGEFRKVFAFRMGSDFPEICLTLKTRSGAFYILALHDIRRGNVARARFKRITGLPH
jgi:hypothetical protein